MNQLFGFTFPFTKRLLESLFKCPATLIPLALSLGFLVRNLKRGEPFKEIWCLLYFHYFTSGCHCIAILCRRSVLRFRNHVNSIAVSEHHHHHNSDSETLQLSIIIIIPLRLLGHFPEPIPELLQGHDYSESIIITPSSLSYSEFITGISYVNGIR